MTSKHGKGSAFAKVSPASSSTERKRAEHGDEYGRPERVKVIGFGEPGEPMIDELFGILCESRMEGRVVTLPLGELIEVQGKPNRQLIEDYCYWLHNWC
jgi:hypothetical protein